MNALNTVSALGLIGFGFVLGFIAAFVLAVWLSGAINRQRNVAKKKKAFDAQKTRVDEVLQ